MRRKNTLRKIKREEENKAEVPPKLHAHPPRLKRCN